MSRLVDLAPVYPAPCQRAHTGRLAFALAILTAGWVLSGPATAASQVCLTPTSLPPETLPAVKLPATTLPEVRLPPVRLPAVHIPRTCVADVCTGPIDIPARVIPGRIIPARHLPAVSIPARRIPGVRLSGYCFEERGPVVFFDSPALGGRVRLPSVFSPTRTTVRTRNYRVVDPSFSPILTAGYWRRSGAASSTPDVAAPGFGELNAAGFPKNQYVRPYVRRDGTFVSGYWRNSPSDGLPTCRVISC